MIKTDEKVKKYLPDWSEKHVPDKTYLCNIINTGNYFTISILNIYLIVHDDSIVKWIKKIKEKKLD